MNFSVIFGPARFLFLLFSLSCLCPVASFGQSATLKSLEVKDGISSYEKGADLLLKGKGAGGVLIGDSLYVGQTSFFVGDLPIVQFIQSQGFLTEDGGGLVLYNLVIGDGGEDISILAKAQEGKTQDSGSVTVGFGYNDDGSRRGGNIKIGGDDPNSLGHSTTEYHATAEHKFFVGGGERLSITDGLFETKGNNIRTGGGYVNTNGGNFSTNGGNFTSLSGVIYHGSGGSIGSSSSYELNLEAHGETILTTEGDGTVLNVHTGLKLSNAGFVAGPLSLDANGVVVSGGDDGGGGDGDVTAGAVFPVAGALVVTGAPGTKEVSPSGLMFNALNGARAIHLVGTEGADVLVLSAASGDLIHQAQLSENAASITLHGVQGSSAGYLYLNSGENGSIVFSPDNSVSAEIQTDGTWDLKGHDLKHVGELELGSATVPSVTVRTHSVDGADNHSLVITAGGGLGGAGDTRGGTVTAYGNEFALSPSLAGALEFRAGNKASGGHQSFYTQALRRFSLGYGGASNFYGNGLLEIGGSPLSGTPGAAGGHGGIGIIGNGLSNTHIQMNGDAQQSLTIGARFVGDGAKGNAHAAWSEYENLAEGGDIRHVAAWDAGTSTGGEYFINTGGVDRVKVDKSGNLALTGDYNFFYTSGTAGSINTNGDYSHIYVSLSTSNIYTKGGWMGAHSNYDLRLAGRGFDQISTFQMPVEQEGDAPTYGLSFLNENIYFNGINFRSSPGPLQVGSDGKVFSGPLEGGGGGGLQLTNLEINDDTEDISILAKAQEGKTQDSGSLEIGFGYNADGTSRGGRIEINGDDPNSLGHSTTGYHAKAEHKFFTAGEERLSITDESLDTKGNNIRTNGGSLFTAGGGVNTSGASITTSGGDIISDGGYILHGLGGSIGAQYNTELTLKAKDVTTMVTETDNRGVQVLNVRQGIKFTNPATGIGAGALYKASDGAVSTTNPSDARLKDVQGGYEGGLNVMLGMRPVRYTFKTPGTTLKDGKPFVHLGFIAQEVQSLDPSLVTEFDHVESVTREKKTKKDKAGNDIEVEDLARNMVKRLGFPYQMPSVVTVNAIKELHGIIGEQKETIGELKSAMEDQESVIDALVLRLAKLEGAVKETLKQ